MARRYNRPRAPLWYFIWKPRSNLSATNAKFANHRSGFGVFMFLAALQRFAHFWVTWWLATIKLAGDVGKSGRRPWFGRRGKLILHSSRFRGGYYYFQLGGGLSLVSWGKNANPKLIVEDFADIERLPDQPFGRTSPDGSVQQISMTGGRRILLLRFQNRWCLPQWNR